MRQTTPVILMVVGVVLLLLMLLVGAWALTSIIQERERAAHAAAIAERERNEAAAQLQVQAKEKQDTPNVDLSPEMLHDPLKFDPDLPEQLPKIKPQETDSEGSNAKGNGFGGGSKIMYGKYGARPYRLTRWTIILPREDSDAYMKKLVQIKALLVIPEGESLNSFKLCDNLDHRPFEFKMTDRKGITAYNRHWFKSQEKTDCDYCARALQLKETPRWVAIFIPQDLEQEMVRKEFYYKKLSEDELNLKGWVTIFDVDRRDDSWEVRVRYQGPRKK
jgi:hypothetical protein